MKIDYTYLFESAEEKPLDRIPEDGGYTGIFRTIGVVGDSLSSGEFQSVGKDGKNYYHDMFEYSWGQFLARTCGSTVYNLSRGGMTAKEYCESFAEHKGFWNSQYACQAYIIALGVNDIYGEDQEVGSIADVDFDDWRNNKPTIAGFYAQIIQRLKEIQPRAKFFLVTIPHETRANEKTEALRKTLYDFADKFDNTYVIDLYEYAPRYDLEFKSRFFMGGHMNPMGYLFTSKIICAYIDYIIRHNMSNFKETGFIGTNLHG